MHLLDSILLTALAILLTFLILLPVSTLEKIGANLWKKWKSR